MEFNDINQDQHNNNLLKIYELLEHMSDNQPAAMITYLVTSFIALSRAAGMSRQDSVSLMNKAFDKYEAAAKSDIH